MTITETAQKAKAAAVHLASAPTGLKNNALAAIAKALTDRRADVVAANDRDCAAAETSNLAKPLLKRLRFDAEKIAAVCRGIDDLIKMPDPVGTTISATALDKGLELYKVTCPIGVIGVIFESRPDALVQISALCLKSGNAVLLKGGSEAAQTNRILAQIIHDTSVAAGLPDGWLGLLETRADVAQMLALDDYIDLIVPRGSNEFVRHIMSNTAIGVLGHADGICHVYIDSAADLDMAVAITVDSKCQYPAVCNAAETLLVHSAIADDFLPSVKAALDEKNVEIRGCPRTRKIIDASAAAEEDWKTEYLDYILSVKVVDTIDDAIDHINKYGSRHTDAIVTQNTQNAAKFMDLVDSADVFHNCSTRFSDGFRYGLGAEVGISTNKIHARGPVGMEGLLIYKWRLLGAGQIVADYSGPNAKSFIHKKLDKEYRLP
jgi:glutamate-5-semialdehyde dehydrogenase